MGNGNGSVIMFLAIDGTTQFRSHLDMMVDDIVEALRGNNPYFKPSLIDFHVNRGATNEYNISLRDGKFGEGKGLYSVFRKDAFIPMLSCEYAGATVQDGHKERLKKILRHALGYVNEGDHPIVLSQWLRDDCNKNIENLFTVFVPLDGIGLSEEDIRYLEWGVFNKMKSENPILCKNEQMHQGHTRPKERPVPSPALEGL